MKIMKYYQFAQAVTLYVWKLRNRGPVKETYFVPLYMKSDLPREEVIEEFKARMKALDKEILVREQEEGKATYAHVLGYEIEYGEYNLKVIETLIKKPKR